LWAKYWLRVLTEIKNRGVRDVCMLVCDGLKGQGFVKVCVTVRDRQGRG
jgi:transposase-like protein